jgi:hypothetical protein
MRNLQNQKHAEAALRVFATLRGSSEEFEPAEEAAELIRVLAGPRVIPSYDETHHGAK